MKSKLTLHELHLRHHITTPVHAKPQKRRTHVPPEKKTVGGQHFVGEAFEADGTGRNQSTGPDGTYTNF